MSQLSTPFNPTAITSSIDAVIALYESTIGVTLRAFYISLFPITLCEGFVYFFLHGNSNHDATTDQHNGGIVSMEKKESLATWVAAFLGVLIGMTLFPFIRKALISNYGGTYKRQGPGYNIDQHYREGPFMTRMQVLVSAISAAIAMLMICYIGCRYYLAHSISSPVIVISLSLILALLTFGIAQEALSTPQFDRVRITKILFTVVVGVLASCLHPIHLLSMMKIDSDHVLATMIFWVQLVLIGLEFNEEINVKRIESAQLRAYSQDKMK